MYIVGSNGQSGASGNSNGGGAASGHQAAAAGSLSGFIQSTLGSILGVNLGSPQGTN